MKTPVKVDVADNMPASIRTLLAGDIVCWGAVPGDEKLWQVNFYLQRIRLPETKKAVWHYCSAEEASHVEIIEHCELSSQRAGAGRARVPVSACDYVRQVNCSTELLQQSRRYADALGRGGAALLSFEDKMLQIDYLEVGGQLSRT